jgi:signal transduction histidine kinase
LVRRGAVWAWWPAAVATVVAGVFSLAVMLLPAVPFGYRNPALHLAMETALSLLALTVAFLVFGRIRQHGHTSDLVLVVALLTLGGSALLHSAAPALGIGLQPPARIWAALAGGSIGAALLLTAAFMDDRPLARRHGRVPALAVACVLLLAISAVTLWLGPSLSDAVRQGSGLSEGRPALVAHVAVTVLQAIAAILYVLAAVGFGAQAARRHDDLMRWLAAACVFATFARMHFVLYPSVFTDWVSAGDLLRGAFFGLLAFAGSRELRSYWQALADVAVLEERRRIARNLHDGLSQELAFIHTQAHRFAEMDGGSLLQPLATSAQRALDESRHAIAALTRPLDEPLDVAIAQAAEEVAERTETLVRFDLARDVTVPSDTREELVRIVREAVANAGSHAQAQHVSVRLENDDGVTVVVEDDGVGFDTDAEVSAGHYGLVSMRERAQRLDGTFTLASEHGRGTRIEVWIP